MNAILENIMTRRSCRAFEKRRIPDADLEQILTAAVYAPTAMNRQTWRFTVLRDADKIAQLARAVGTAIGREGYDFYQPDTLVIVSNVRTNANAIADAGCAMQNIMLMAHSLGVASCWINQMKDTNGDPAVRAAGRLRRAGRPRRAVLRGAGIWQPCPRNRAQHDGGTLRLMEKPKRFTEKP